MHRAIANKRRGDPLNGLERKVLDLLVEGRTIRQARQALGISSTALWYRGQCAAKKLGASDVHHAAIKYAVAVAKGRKP